MSGNRGAMRRVERRIAGLRPYMHDERRVEKSTSPASSISIFTRTHAATRGLHIGRESGGVKAGAAEKSNEVT